MQTFQREGINRVEDSLGSTEKSRWHSNTNAALKHWQKEMLPVLNHKSTAHWHLGCCYICSLPCPSTLHPGNPRMLSHTLGHCL